MTRVSILGATGYTALELVKILLRHPHVEITAVTSRQEGNPPISAIHPSLTDRLELALEDLSPAEVAARAECVRSSSFREEQAKPYFATESPSSKWKTGCPAAGDATVGRQARWRL